MKALLAAAAILLGMIPAYAQTTQDQNSANFMLPHCREAMTAMASKKVWSAFGGICLGQINAVMTMAGSLQEPYRFCPPAEGTNAQSVAVVVKFLDGHPEVWQENFTALSVIALRQAWPCR